jgi:hypothetical protein
MVQQKNIDFDIDSSIVKKKGLVSLNMFLFGTLSQTTNVDKKSQKSCSQKGKHFRAYSSSVRTDKLSNSFDSFDISHRLTHESSVWVLLGKGRKGENKISIISVLKHGKLKQID